MMDAEPSRKKSKVSVALLHNTRQHTWFHSVVWLSNYFKWKTYRVLFANSAREKVDCLTFLINVMLGIICCVRFPFVASTHVYMNKVMYRIFPVVNVTLLYFWYTVKANVILKHTRFFRACYFVIVDRA